MASLHRFIRNRTFIILTVAFIVYSVYWSFTTIMKFYALDHTVFDLGIFMQTLWETYHTNWNFFSIYSSNSFLPSLANQGLRFFIFPLAFFKNYPLLLAFQSISIGSTVFPIFLISRTKMGDKIALTMSFIYLLYFPLAGINLFDIHFQAFFIPLFVYGHYFYERKKMISSTFLLFLAGIVRFPYGIFIIIYFILIILQRIPKNGRHKGEKSELIVSVFMISLMSILSFMAFLNTGIVRESSIIGVNTLNQDYSLTLDRLMTIFYMFIPFFFLPFFSKRWFILLSPYLILLCFTTNRNLIYPLFFGLQYSSMVIPFLILGTIYGLENLTNLKVNHKLVKIHIIKTNNNKKLAVGKRIAGALLVTSILLAFVFQPFGPFENVNPIPINTAGDTNTNLTTYNEVSALVRLIPNNNPYVLFQDNLPQVLPRPLEYNGTPLISNFIYPNFTLNENGNFVKVRIDYVLADPYSSWFTYKPLNSKRASMIELFNSLLESGKFGVLGEDGGVVLLDQGYSGVPKVFQGFSDFISPHDLEYSSSNISRIQQLDSISGHNLTKEFLFYGGYTTLAPGKYNITFQIGTNNVSLKNAISLQLLSDNLYTSTEPNIIIESNITSNKLSLKLYTNVSFDFTLNSYHIVQFRGYVDNWYGTISIYNIYLKQVSWYD